MTFTSYLKAINFYRYLSIVALFAWAVIMTIAFMIKGNETIVIGIDENGTRHISRYDDPLLQAEVVNFLVKFTENLYSFTPSSYFERVGSATEMMTSSLWEKERESLVRTGEVIKKDDVGLSSTVTKIEHQRGSTATYVISLDSKEKRKLSQKKRSVTLTVSLIKTDRTKDNPWGLLVESYHETHKN